MEIWDVIRRWHEGHSISQISQALGYDRKTVRSYLRLATRIGLSLEGPLPPRETVLDRLKAPRRTLGRNPTVQMLLEPYLQEIADLVNDPELGVKAKTAFEVVARRHELLGKVSYPTFKRFARANKLVLQNDRTTCRIEVAPGSEIQLDYALICLWSDPASRTRRRLYAFIGTLSHSRLKYVELTTGQNQTSFTNSHIRMFEAFGGVPARIVLDNLKAGVLKPDLYDPRFNRSYGELAQHYGLFLDPARVRHPRDKGKVERDVQTVREAARKILHLHPGASLSELNQAIRHWAFHEYGERPHGTTGEAPYTVFLQREKPVLKSLPEQPFEVAEWKQATVHPDHYVQFHGKAYSVPHAYVGKQVWIRATEHLLQVYSEDALVKQHVITGAYRHTDYSDFPPNVRHALDSGLHRLLLTRSQVIGPEFHRMIRELLEIHAFVNLRRAQGLLAVAEEARSPWRVEQAARFMLENELRFTPHDLRHLLNRLAAQDAAERMLPVLSEATREFVRDASYFIHPAEGGAA
jgi:transposase